MSGSAFQHLAGKGVKAISSCRYSGKGSNITASERVSIEAILLMDFLIRKANNVLAMFLRQTLSNQFQSSE